MDLSKFNKFMGKECKLTKIGSKRENYFVDVGHSQHGEMDLYEYLQTDTSPAATGVILRARGFNFLRTSPIVKVTDETSDSLIFETEGGVYKLDLVPKNLYTL